jgi:8-oxo-dGTP pyrophosphatase MutT (NUDIX family)
MGAAYGATGFLFHVSTRKVLLHLRDPDAPIYPNSWSFFGGSSEVIDGGDPVRTWLRELREELGIVVRPDQAIPLSEGHFASGKRRYAFYCLWPELAEDFVLGEGQAFAWFDLSDAMQLPALTPVARQDLRLFQSKLRPAS